MIPEASQALWRSVSCFKLKAYFSQMSKEHQTAEDKSRNYNPGVHMKHLGHGDLAEIAICPTVSFWRWRDLAIKGCAKERAQNSASQ